MSSRLIRSILEETKIGLNLPTLDTVSNTLVNKTLLTNKMKSLIRVDTKTVLKTINGKTDQTGLQPSVEYKFD